MSDLAHHPLANIIPGMMTDEAVALARDIQANGQRQAIVLYDGKILDGRHRYAVCQKLGIEPRVEAFTGTEADAKALVLSLNVHRRHLTFAQREALIEAELRRDPEQSNRMIAEVAKVSPTTVGNVRAKAEAKGMVSTVDTITGRDGVKQPAKKAVAAPTPTPAEAMPADAKRTLTSASWPRNSGPVAIAHAILDALGDTDLARRVGRQLEKRARKAANEPAGDAQVTPAGQP